MIEQNLVKLEQNLYETDYYLWLKVTEKHLREGRFAEVDLDNLIEEIESLGKAEKRKVNSYLRQLLIHLLVYRYWQVEREYSGRGWIVEIDNFRYELNLLLQSKTLYNLMLSEFDAVYQAARKAAIKKSGLDSALFPVECPLSAEEVLEEDFLP
ncbi:MAG: DUF29 domain-containing protein [Symploca sp. SIO2E6]|nr:DUF29 domain-containing protein [Symploca sp. SIO2E6]